MTAAWQRVAADRHPGCATCGVKTVYWGRDAGEYRLTVSPPRYSDGLGWRWRLYGPTSGTARPGRPARRETVVAEGFEGTVAAAKAAAEAAAR